MYYNGSAWVRAAAGTRKPAGMYVNTGGHIAFLTAAENSGTSATISERVRITNDGLVAIGHDTPSSFSSGANNLVVNDAAGAGGITIVTPTNAEGAIFFADGTGGSGQGRVRYNPVSYTHLTLPTTPYV